MIREEEAGSRKRKPYLRRLLLVGGILFVMLVGGGCTPKKGFVTLSYLPEPKAARIPGAEQVFVEVKVVDARGIQDRVSATKNLQGVEVAPIVSRNDVVELVDQAIRSELRNRGFNVDGGQRTCEVEVQTFYNDFKPGFWYRQAKAKSSFLVCVRDADGNVLYTKRQGNEYTRAVCLTSAKQAKIALETVLRDSMKALFSDKGFYEALLGK